jgi:hypothetical protein
VQAAVAVFNVLINLWLIPAYSWRGAAWSSIASDGVLLISVATAVCILSRRAVQAPAVTQVSRELEFCAAPSTVTPSLKPNAAATEPVDVF